MILEPFDQLARCPKCTACYADYRYHASSGCVPTGDDYIDVVSWFGGAAFPHLHRRCARCEYEWLTETADAA